MRINISQLKETKELRNKMEKSETGIPVSQLIEVYKGNSGKYSHKEHGFIQI